MPMEFYKDLFNTRETLFCCHYAYHHHEMTLVRGDAGCGKTTALRHFADNTPDVLLVTANACTTTPAAILGAICHNLDLPVPGRKAALMSSLVEYFSEAGKLLILDEADHLSLEALQAIRNLNDLTGLGIVVSCNDRLYFQMVSGKNAGYAQLWSRFSVRKHVVNDYTVQEIEAIFPGVSQECTGKLLEVACGESLRTARKLYDVASEFSAVQGKPLTAKCLRDTQKQLFGEGF